MRVLAFLPSTAALVAWPVSRLSSVVTMSTSAKPKTALEELKDGKFTRSQSKHRSLIEEGGEFPPESGRYHLHVALACPWACGTLSMLFMKGLDDAITHSVVHPTWGKTKPDDPADKHTGWIYRNPGDDPVPNPLGYGSNEVDGACIPDPLGAQSIREVYERNGDFVGKFTTPVLEDKVTGTIVSNESLDILRILNARLNAFAKHPEVDLFPEGLEDHLNDLNSWIYTSINDGVYKVRECGSPKSVRSGPRVTDDPASSRPPGRPALPSPRKRTTWPSRSSSPASLAPTTSLPRGAFSPGISSPGSTSVSSTRSCGLIPSM